MGLLIGSSRPEMRRSQHSWCTVHHTDSVAHRQPAAYDAGPLLLRDVRVLRAQQPVHVAVCDEGAVAVAACLRGVGAVADGRGQEAVQVHQPVAHAAVGERHLQVRLEDVEQQVIRTKGVARRAQHGHRLRVCHGGIELVHPRIEAAEVARVTERAPVLRLAGVARPRAAVARLVGLGMPRQQE
eukprot:scaffold76808_cov66-Phaeocystis_antarctica.AAC.2